MTIKSKTQTKKSKPKPETTTRRKTKKKTLATILSEKKTTPPHLIIEARAGTGKTTTLIEGLRVMRGQKSKFKPSSQQKDIWESMVLSKDAKTICFAAFNKSIATELQERVPEGCNAMTMHSMGFKAIRKQFDNIEMNNFRVDDIILNILGFDGHYDCNKRFPGLLKATKNIVSLCKMNLIDGTNESDLWELCHRHDIDLNGESRKVFDLIPQVLDQCKQVDQDHKIDFNDMIWLPVILKLPVFKYQLLLVDECQDLNRCQQSLAMMAGQRLILVGDTKQAIYGFAGADSESMSRMLSHLKQNGGCQILPLTVTRRCGKAIVKEAQRYVPDFEAHKLNSEGAITQSKFKEEKGSANDTELYRQQVSQGDMILCRVNAPLVSECFKFLSEGRKSQIQGRDIGQSLINTIDKLKATNIGDLISKLSIWLSNEETKENKKRNPNENYLINLRDRHDCIICFANNFEPTEITEQVKEKINDVFTDNKQIESILLSSIHKAKGLEAQHVFLLQPEGASIPHPMAKSEWQIAQEYNILYVAITRAIDTLTYVS